MGPLVACVYARACNDGITWYSADVVVTDSASIEVQLAANIAFNDMMSMADASFDDAVAHSKRKRSGLPARLVVVDFTVER